jgi:hypothetical protein
MPCFSARSNEFGVSPQVIVYQASEPERDVREPTKNTRINFFFKHAALNGEVLELPP